LAIEKRVTDITCSFCGKKFNTRAGFSLHLTKTESKQFNNEIEKERYIVDTLFGEEYVNTTIKLYADQQLCIDDIYKSGKDIIKLITLLGLKRTSKEERETERYKSTYLKSIQSVYGEDITNVSQLKVVQSKIKNTLAQQHGSYDVYVATKMSSINNGYKKYVGTEKHKSTVEKIKATCVDKYGHENFGCGVEAKEKSKAAKALLLNQMTYEEKLAMTTTARKAVCHRGGYSSKPEKRVREALRHLGIEFNTNVHLWNYNYDMVFDKIIVEVQGDMWHGNPKMYKPTDLIMKKIPVSEIWDKDKRKKDKAEENGYCVIYVWEDEIRKRNDIQLTEYVENLLKIGEK
jgi:G:T-mismatch repair DNA endonuclease (very short patch repair protein)